MPLLFQRGGGGGGGGINIIKRHANDNEVNFYSFLLRFVYFTAPDSTMENLLWYRILSWYLISTARQSKIFMFLIMTKQV